MSASVYSCRFQVYFDMEKATVMDVLDLNLMNH